MPQVKPFTLDAAQELVRDGIKRSERRWEVWRALEMLYRRGDIHDSLLTDDVPAILWSEFPDLTLDSINLVLPNSQMVIANIMSHDPGFLVEPYAGGEAAEQEAKIGEHLLKYFWHRTEGTETFRSMVQDAVILGCGIYKTGWIFEEEEIEREDNEVVEELLRLQDAELSDADLMERDPKSIDDLAGEVPLTTPRTLTDEPFLEYVSPYDILVDHRARRLTDARWVAQRVIMPLDEIKANPNFSPKAVKDLTTVAGDHDRPRERAGQDEREVSETPGDGTDPFAEATLWELYDTRVRRLMVFQENAETPLFNEPYPYSHRHLPFGQIRNFEDGDRFWPFGDIENAAAIQEEYNQYVFEQMSSARRSGNKYVVDKSSYTDKLRAALESEKSDVVSPIDLPGNKTLQEVFMPVPRQPVTPEVFQAKQDLSDALRDVLGINELQAGLGLGDRASATEAAVMDGNATLRSADKKYQIERAAAGAGLRMLLLCQEFLDEPTALRIVDSQGVPEWLDVSRDELQGEYRVSVTSGSTMAVNPATRMARALDVMTQIIPALMDAGYDPHPLWRQALRDYGMDPDRMLIKMPPEMAPEGMPLPGGGSDPTVPQEALGGPPVPAATQGDTAL